MDEYYCAAYPLFSHFAATPGHSVPENPFCPDDQCFNIEVEYTDLYFLNVRKFEARSDTTYHSFHNISKDNMMQETTIVALLCSIGVPEDAHEFMVEKILSCARNMANAHTHQKVLPMCVLMFIPRVSEDTISEDDDDDIEEEEEEDNIINDDVEASIEDQDYGLVPAAKSSIEELETVSVVEGSVTGRCVICFEDIDVVGVRMPCLHMFHRNCIVDWLQIGNSCPVCRFQMPICSGSK